MNLYFDERKRPHKALIRHMKFVMSIAGVAMEVEHRHPYIARLCRDFLSDAEPVFSVFVTDELMDAERAMTNESFPEAVLESTCLQRQITQKLVAHGIILIHSAVIAVDGEAYVFAAPSGVGKSTHIRLWKDVFGDRAVIVNGDKPFFSFEGEQLIAHGAPWCGKEGWGANISAPVKAIGLLDRGEQNSVARATGRDAISRIFSQVLLPQNPADLSRFIDVLDHVLCAVPAYCLKVNMEKEAALITYAGMQGSSQN